jgi:subtilisin family serine protease
MGDAAFKQTASSADTARAGPRPLPAVQPSPNTAATRLFVFLLALVLAAVVAPCAAARGDATNVVVGFRSGVSASAIRRALGGARAIELRHLHAAVLRGSRAATRATVRRLELAGLVAYAEPDRVLVRVTQYEQLVPSDPLWPQQWGAAAIQAPAAWAVTTGSASTIVAVLDTGVDATQPDLAGALVPGYDFVNGDADPSDDFGHGTSVAGIIAARLDNGAGVAGVCPDCAVMPVKVVGSDGTGLTSTIAEGMTWAVDHGARVVNLSLGGPAASDVLASAVDYARAHGVLVVAAAGNNGNTNAFYPASYPGVVSVAASDPQDHLYPWSDSGSWVDVAAPGCDLAPSRGGGFGDFCGTSASTPVVSGLAGLALSFAPGSTADGLAQALESTAAPVGGVAFGRVDAARMLQALGAALRSAAPPPAPAAAPAAPPAKPSPARSKRRLRTFRRPSPSPLSTWQLRWFVGLEPEPGAG